MATAPNLSAIPECMTDANRETAFRNTGAVEQDKPEQETNVASFEAQLDHTFQDSLNKASDSGMPNRGQTPEFTGEKQEGNELERDTNAHLPNRVEDEIKQADQQRLSKTDTAEHTDTDQNAQNFDTRAHGKKVEPPQQGEEVVDQDPGERQKENQNKKKDDDLAA
ncbi:MAG TPA: hypothetical protein VFU86_00170 [Terriglobales bacterium]|nr:hypothetical protein [Terriglobales bacterium]